MLGKLAERYIGTPYRHQGRTPGLGLDCAGVLVCSLQAAGVAVNDCRTYDRVPPRDLLRDMVERHGLTREESPPIAGDVCLFWMRHKRLVIHCGIVADNGVELIHVEDGRRVERVPLRVWKPQLAATYSAKEVQRWQS
jgi:hypothetical protein